MSDRCATERSWALRVAAAGVATVLAAHGGLAAQPASESKGHTVPELIASKTVSELVVTAPKTVSELVVTASLRCKGVQRSSSAVGAPSIVSTFPANGQVVRPGLVAVRITFDAPVACAGGLGDDPPLANPCPDDVQRMVLSYDRRTVRTVCRVDPDKLYSVWLSRTPQNGFLSLKGVQARPYRLQFATSGDAAITTVCAALAQDAETVREIAQRRALDCAEPADEAETRIAADVLRRDAQARRAIELAREDVEAQRLRREAHELEAAQTLARAAYAKAFREKRADYDRALRQARRAALNSVDSERLGPDITAPSRAGGGFDREGLASLVTGPASRPTDWGPTRPPPPPDVALAGWSASFAVNGHVFVCNRQAQQISCHRS